MNEKSVSGAADGLFTILSISALDSIDMKRVNGYNMNSNLKMNFKMEALMKKIIALTLFVLCLSGFACAEGLDVVATNFPCYDFARQVAGEMAEVTMLIRPGTEVHAFEPSPSDILTIGDADLFVYVGGESDAWADDILESFDDRLRTVRLMDHVSLLEEEHYEGDGHAHHHHHDHGELALDEHIWTSPKNALQMLRAVEDALCAASPENEETFRVNANEYAAQIEALDAQLQHIVAEAKRHTLLVADRFPFLYMAHDYGLEYSAAFTSCASETEPSAKKLVELIENIRADEIPVVYTIEMSTGNIARTLAEETGAEIMELHSAQTVRQSEFDAGESYVSLMKKNLAAIEKGLN